MVVEAGQIVRVRSRQYLVEDVTAELDQDTLVRLSCLEDDALGEPLEVLWERELDAQTLGANTWERIANRGFDEAQFFSAYLHTLRWNCVTSTEPKLFQAPYRAGIEVKAYQLEPLRKALLMPRVALFIADDVGLGKTIEAGLILREMLMRQKVRRVVIACPPSVVQQWRDEMEQRFGLTFVVFDRSFMAARRQERGYGINPWTTHTRFIISHALLRDETYAAPLRDWLGEFCATSMLILDEAHNAAPASGSKYAVDSQLTKTLREIAPRFEHKLFLSATPHNGHSNSFAALLEMLDPQRFCRGVPVRNPKLLDAVMVRRLKRDLREVGVDDFPRRFVIPIAIDNLPEDAAELKLSRLLQAYRVLRQERLQQESKAKQATAMLVVTNLQKRLLSSIEAFARTLKVHRTALEKQAQTHNKRQRAAFSLLMETPGADDDRAELSEDEIQSEEDSQMAAATRQLVQVTAQELQLLEEMTEVANAARYQPDVRVERLIGWIRENLCPNLGKPGAQWLERRVLIFTEYTDTKRYLLEQLESAIAGCDRAAERIDVFHGGIGEERREAIKLAFNTDPSRHPLRILIATDAAREGVNLQNYCADLFHFDIPWNPSRMEQRNGRIDRKLQRSPEVRCYYFILPQRAEDRVLEVLVKKTQTIQQELGSLTPVVQKNISRLFAEGISSQESDRLADKIERVDHLEEEGIHSRLIQQELEETRITVAKLSTQVGELQKMLQDSRNWLQLDDRHFRDAICASLELVGANPLTPLDPNEAAKDPETARWEISALDQRLSADPTWMATLDSLRPPRHKGQKLWEWRRETSIRPVVFRDPGTLDGEVVHLHLEHRVVQRLLGRFLSQGFLYDELSRVCICLCEDPVPKVIALGRLSLYGERASRLHDEVIAVAADWSEPTRRSPKKLQPFNETQKKDILGLLEDSLAVPRFRQVPDRVKEHLSGSVAQDVAELLSPLENRADVLSERAKKKLMQRGEKEAAEMQQILQEQRDRILSQQKETEAIQLSLFPEEEQRQIDADRRYWGKRLQRLELELVEEPARIQATYQVKAQRLEPVGLIYLWPISS